MMALRRRDMQQTASDLMHDIDAVVQPEMDIRDAANLLAGKGVLPVVDSRGRCLGVFTAADYRRWLDVRHSHRKSSKPTDEVRNYMEARFAAATPDMGVQQLAHCLKVTTNPFVIVLDRQARPRGIVFELDVMAAQTGVSFTDNRYVLTS